MSLGSVAFLSPWLLAGLLALPVIWWLLRTIPPRPRRLAFPPTRILMGVENREQTPAQTPWWLTLIRMLAAALVILALAEPVLNANREKALELAAGLTKSPKEVLASYFITPRDYYRDPNGCVTAATVQKPIDAMVEYKLIDRPIDASKYLQLQYLPKPCAT